MAEVAYINPPLETDPTELANDVYDRLAEALPGWEPSPAAIETILVEVLAPLASENRDVASAVPVSIFQYLGASLLGLDPVAEASASVSSTWTMIDTDGYTIPEGTVVGIRDATGTRHAFTVLHEVAVLAGQSSTAAGEVTLLAQEAGADVNGIAGPATLEDALDFVESIAMVGTPSSGVDAETTDAYMNRLVSELRLLTPRPILPEDFAVLYRRIAGVYRTVAIDGYNPADSTYNNERMVAVAGLSEEGGVVGVTAKAAGDAYLQSLREANFVVNIIDPTFTEIDVSFTGVCHDWADPSTVEVAAEAAIAEYLSPALWGVKIGLEREWSNVTVVRYLEVAEALNKVDGFDYITALTVEGGTANVNLTGPAPVTQPGTISGTVSAP